MLYQHVYLFKRHWKEMALVDERGPLRVEINASIGTSKKSSNFIQIFNVK